MSAWTIPSYAEWAVPGYTEDRLLGHGVSGRVVAAASDSTGRPVAIKYLNTDLVRDQEFLFDLRSEAEQLKALDAPHMVRLFDYVEQPGAGAAVVTELIEGVSLREMIARRGPLSAPGGLVVLKDSLIALAAAHSRRIAHRDVKPDNVLIDAIGWCTLTDFGVAVKADHSPVPGTPAYMAPELWNGGTSVPATDLYAATAVLYESVTGRPPFSGRPGQLRQHHESTPVVLDQVDPPLADLVRWGLAKNPADRPRSARAFLFELDARANAAYGPTWEDQGRRELAERAQALLPLLAAGGGGSVTATRTARRKLLTFIVAAAAAVVAIVAVGAFALASRSSTPQLTSSSTAAFTAQVTATPPVAASKCTTATTFAYKGTVTATETGTVSYRWVYSSGKQGAVQKLSFAAPGHQLVSGGAVKSRKAGKGWAEIKVLSPVKKTSNKATYSLLCGATDADIALSASVVPAAETVTSCAGTAPTLTAAGFITSKTKGTVSYYWALGNGQTSAANTLTFAGPGTKTAVPMSITPSALPASGTAELVVTKPSAATSSPAPYSVGCKTTPATSTSKASVPASAPASAKKSASPSASASKTSASPSPSTTSPSPSPSTTSPSPSPSTTSPTPTPTPTPTTSSPTPTPTPTTPTPTTSSPASSAPVSTPPASAKPTPSTSTSK